MMSGANQLYFCSNAFLPGFLLHSGHTEWIAPALTTLNGGQLPASFILLGMSARWERKKWLLLCAGVIGLSGIAGVLSATGLWSIVGAAALIGFACAIVLTLVLALPALMVSPDDVPRMSAGVFTIGYGVAMTVSVLGGIVWDVSGHPAFAFIPVAAATLFIILSALSTDFSRRAPGMFSAHACVLMDASSAGA